MNPLLLSVIIPTCHRNDLLALCLNRLAPGIQTLSNENYEVIVTDDGSSSTAEQLIVTQYPWAKWVEGPRKGPAANRNNGASKAKGQLFVFFDDDCEPDSNILMEYSLGFLAYKEDKMVFEGRITCEPKLSSPLFTAPINLNGGNLWSCNFAISKIFFGKIGGFDERYIYPALEDMDFKNRIILNGGKLVFCEKCTVNHPPRRIPPSKRLAKYHEGYYIHFPEVKRKKIKYNIILDLVKCRLLAVFNYPFGLDSLIAIRNFFLEVVFVFVYSRKWEQKYK